jgi:hypothetical protein
MHVIAAKHQAFNKIKKDTIFEVSLHLREEGGNEYVLVDHPHTVGMIVLSDDVILYRKEGFDLNETNNCCWLRINANGESNQVLLHEIKSNEGAVHVLLSDTEFIK